MAEQKFNEIVGSLFEGMESYMTTKTVVGDAVTIGDTTILPLVDVSFGMGAGAVNKEKGNSAAGGMGAKMKPAAVLVIKGDSVRIVSANSSDPVSKVIDMAPDLINRFVKKTKEDPEVEEAIENIVSED